MAKGVDKPATGGTELKEDTRTNLLLAQKTEVISDLAGAMANQFNNIMMAVKESVHNVVKHATASEVTIKVTFEGKMLRVAIQDNGCGFEPAEAAAGNGLTNMKRRLQDIGGTCVVESRPGQGTTVHLQLVIPLVQPDSWPAGGADKKNHGERHEHDLE